MTLSKGTRVRINAPGSDIHERHGEVIRATADNKYVYLVHLYGVKRNEEINEKYLELV